MRVDFSEWYTSTPGLVARKYTYSRLANMRDFDVEVRFEIQAGLSIFIFVTFLISDFELPRETALRMMLHLMEGGDPHANMNVMARPDGRSGAVLVLMGRNDPSQCAQLFQLGRELQLELYTTDGQALAKLPLPNDSAFQTAFSASYEAVRAEDAAEFKGQDGVMGRVDRFIRGLSGR